MNDLAKRMSRLSLVLPLALAAGGCQKVGQTAADAAIARATGVAIDRDGEQAGLHGEAAPDARGGRPVALPADFPEDVYLPVHYQVNSVMDLQGVSMISLSAPGEVGALLADARETMRAAGWTQSMSAQHSADSAVLAFEKGEPRRSATLSFNRNNGERHVIVGVQLHGGSR